MRSHGGDPPGQTNEERAINKKNLAIIGVLIVFAFTWDTLLGWLGHAIILILEWLELTVDTIYEELLNLAPEASQMATAWTGFLAALALIGWGAYRLRKLYLVYKDKALAWKQTKQAEFSRWWAALPWFKKLGYAASVCAFVALMIVTN